jgi:serine/threonine protein kinase
MKPANVCLSKSVIPLLLSGDMPPAETTAAESHIAECELCRSAIESMIADSRWWDDARYSLAASATRSLDAAHVAASVRDAEGSLAEEVDAIAASLGETRLRESVLDLLGPTDDPNMLGRIGTYEIVGLLGQGGMGAVFKGFDRSLNRFVAIKMLLPHLAASGAARKRFAREGQAVAAVVDDHVMAIHCVAEWQGVPYLVMNYSRGISLQKRLSDSGPLEVREILRIGMQATKGLAAAHAQGIVHRDIKPANIFLDQNVERVQLMDFGLARAVDDASLTRSGTLAGTPQYMSPEQARAETVDHRSDLFSLGSVMYAMCTGHAPFRAESSYSVLRLITDKEPRPIREINPDVPEWLCAIIWKLMAKEASDRFASAKEVAELLEGGLAHVQQPAVMPLPEIVATLLPTKTRHRPLGKFIVATAFTFAILFAGVFVVLELNKGTLTIQSDADDIRVRITRGEEVVNELKVTQSGKSVRLSAGQYEVEVIGEADGLTVENGQVTLHRADTEVVKITHHTHDDNLRMPDIPSVFQSHPKATDRVKRAFESAASVARKDDTTFNTLHLLAALMRDGSLPELAEVAKQKKISMSDLINRCDDAARVAERLFKATGDRRIGASQTSSTEQWKELFEATELKAKEWKHDYLGPAHFLMALIADDPLTKLFLKEQGIEATEIRDMTMQIAFSRGQDAPVVHPLPEQPATHPETKPDPSVSISKPKRLQIREAAVVEASANPSQQSVESNVVEFSGMRLRLNPAQPAILTEDDILTVESLTDPNHPETAQIVLTLTPEAGERFLIETTRLSSQPNPAYLVIEFDGVALSAPRVIDKIRSKVAISASKEDDLERLVAAIRESIRARGSDAERKGPSDASVPPRSASSDSASASSVVGHWRVSKLADMPADELAGATVVIDETSIKMHVPSQKGPHPHWRYTLVAEGEMDLREMDDAKGETTSRAKVSLDGKTLYLALNAKKGDYPRPESATGEVPQAGVQYIVLEMDELANSTGTGVAPDGGDERHDDRPQEPAQPSLGKKLQQLQGNWQLTRQIPPDGDESITPDKAVWEFKGDRIIVRDDGPGSAMLIEVDDTQSPVHVKLTNEIDEVSGLGLMSVEGDQAIFCLMGELQKTPEPQSRPEKLHWVSGVWYMELTRVKPGETIVPLKPKVESRLMTDSESNFAATPTPTLADQSKAPKVDHGNARSVVEAYVALALAGDAANAAALAKNSPANPKRIAEIPKFLNVQRLKFQTVYVNDPAKPTLALATSQAVRLDEEHKQPNGQRDGFMVFRLELTNNKWFVIDIDFDSESSAEKELKRFLEANPNSIGLPPQPQNLSP